MFPHADFEGVENQQPIEQTEKNKMKKINTKTIMRGLITIRGLIDNNWIFYYKILKETQMPIGRKIKRIMKKQKNDIQDMKMYHPEEQMILYDDEDKDDAVIDEEKFYCAGVRRSI